MLIKGMYLVAHHLLWCLDQRKAIYFLLIGLIAEILVLNL